MLRKIAIIGANGLVGRNVLKLAVSRGIETLGVVRSASGVELVQALGGVPARVADLEETRTRSLIPLLRGCDGLVYTASVATGAAGADRTDPTGLINTLAAGREAGVSRALFYSGLGIAHYGMSRHCTSAYFLAKMAGEVALFRSGFGATVFRPSYIFGHGDDFLTPLLGRIAAGEVLEIPGDGSYRLQPVSVEDAARASLSALDEPGSRVIDLVGPEIVSYRELIRRIASQTATAVETRQRPVEDAMAMARATGYFGMRPHDLDCLLCDEVADPSPVKALVGAPLESLVTMIARTLDALRASPALRG
jgi:uncharacterized protein YbjT (DUF2867 family)